MIIHDTGYFKLHHSTSVYRSHLEPSRRLEVEKISIPHHYKINSFGFRCHHDFNKLLGQQVNLCIGDSFVMNEGDTYEESWPYLIDQQLSIPTLNLGINGAGNDLLALIFIRAKRLFDVQNVYVMFSFLHRYYKRSLIPPFRIHCKNNQSDKKGYVMFEKSFNTFNMGNVNFKFSFPFSVYYRDQGWEYLDKYRNLLNYIDYGAEIPIEYEELISTENQWTGDDGLHFSAKINQDVANAFIDNIC